MLLTDDQKMLQETAASFLAAEGGIAKQLRHWRDTDCSDGFGTALWNQFGELGLAGIAIPESHGGMGMGATEAALVLEEVGRNLTPSPFLMTSVAAPRAIERVLNATRVREREDDTEDDGYQPERAVGEARRMHERQHDNRGRDRVDGRRDRRGCPAERARSFGPVEELREFLLACAGRRDPERREPLAPVVERGQPAHRILATDDLVRGGGREQPRRQRPVPVDFVEPRGFIGAQGRQAPHLDHATQPAQIDHRGPLERHGKRSHGFGDRPQLHETKV